MNEQNYTCRITLLINNIAYAWTAHYRYQLIRYLSNKSNSDKYFENYKQYNLIKK